MKKQKSEKEYFFDYDEILEKLKTIEPKTNEHLQFEIGYFLILMYSLCV